MACEVIYNGERYSHAEFATLLHDGLLDEFVSNNIIDSNNLKEGGQNAVKIRQIEQNDQQQHQGVDGQQQGEQENRQHEEKPIPQAKAEPSDSNINGEGRSIKEEITDKNKKLINLASESIESNEIRSSLSNKGREGGVELTEEQKQYNATRLLDALNKGEDFIVEAKNELGEKGYVSGILDLMKDNSIPIENRSVILISLENDLNRRLLSDPDDLTLKKQEALVTKEVLKYQRSTAKATAFGRLRQIAKLGYDVSQITDQFFSEKQLRERRTVVEAIESDIDAIQKEAESKESTVTDVLQDEIQEAIAKGVEKQINDIYENLPTKRRQLADKAIKSIEKFESKLKGKAYDATIGIPIAIIRGGLATIKAAIKAGVAVADAVELGIKQIKEKYGKEWDKESDFRNDVIGSFEQDNVELNTGDKISLRQEVKQALIDAGYGKSMSFKNKEGIREKREVLDWKKLAGEEGSIDNIKESVESSLKKKGWTEKDIADISEELIEEYNDLRASIIDKSLSELERGNTPREPYSRNSSAYRLAQLYNMGLFDKEADTYDYLLNKALGLSGLEQEVFAEGKELAKALSDLYKTRINGKRVDEFYIKDAVRAINDKISNLLTKQVLLEGSTSFKIAKVASEYMNMAQNALLVSLKQAIDNPLSGYRQEVVTNLFDALSGNNLKEINKLNNDYAKNVFKDINVRGGQEFGEVTTPFISRSYGEVLLRDAADSKKLKDMGASEAAHSIISTNFGTIFLNAADSYFKVKLTQKYFVHNLIKVLSDKTNPNRMEKDDAIKYVNEQLTGQKFEEAVKNAKEIIQSTNERAGKEILADNKEMTNRLAMNLVKMQLLTDNVITDDLVQAAYKSAYTAAGFDLGHEANNFVSKQVKNSLSANENELRKAIKEKKWGEATKFQLYNIMLRNIMNPFVSGGTNWAVLGLQWSGFDIISPLSLRADKRDNPLDLSTVEGLRNVEKSLLADLKYKNTNRRLVVGALITGVMAGIALGSDVDDDWESFLKRNPWSKRFANIITPPIWQIISAFESGKNSEIAKSVLEKAFNRNDAFDDAKNVSEAIGKIFSDNEKTKAEGRGELGAFIGGKTSLPLPYKITGDLDQVIRGISNRPLRFNDFKTSGFWNGYFKTGVGEIMGYRPDKIYDRDLRSLIDGKNNPEVVKFINDASIKSISNSGTQFYDSKGIKRNLTYKEAEDYDNYYAKYALSEYNKVKSSLPNMKSEQRDALVKSVNKEALSFAMQKMNLAPKDLNKFTVDGKDVILSTEQIKKRIGFINRYKADNRGKIQDWADKIMEKERVNRTDALIKAKEKLDREAKEYSKKQLKDMYGDRLKGE